MSNAPSDTARRPSPGDSINKALGGAAEVRTAAILDQLIADGWAFTNGRTSESFEPAHKALHDAAVALIRQSCDYWRDRAGKTRTFEDESGEKCCVVPSDAIAALGAAITDSRPRGTVGLGLPEYDTFERLHLRAMVRSWFEGVNPGERGGDALADAFQRRLARHGVVSGIEARNVLSSLAGHTEAFHEAARMLGIPAQSRSPEDVWETEMRPALTRLIADARGASDGAKK